MNLNGTEGRPVTVNANDAAILCAIMRLTQGIAIEANQLAGSYNQPETAEFLRDLMNRLKRYGDEYVRRREQLVQPASLIPDLLKDR